LYGFDLTALQPFVDRHGMTPDEVMTPLTGPYSGVSDPYRRMPLS
jgi:hypothetical protein